MTVQTAKEIRELEKTNATIKRNVLKANINTNQVINWALVTAEFQTAYKVAPKLRRVAPDGLLYKIDNRLHELERLQQQELLLSFNIMTKDGQLATTPIYPIVEGDVLYEYYIMSVYDYGLDDLNTGMRDVGLIRHQSDVLYTANAPIFKIAKFLEAEGYIELLKDKSISDDKLNAIHLTLISLYLCKSSDLPSLVASGVLDLDTLDTLKLGDVIK